MAREADKEWRNERDDEATGTTRAKGAGRIEGREKIQKERGRGFRDREHSAGSSYSRDATKISRRPFRNRSARVRPEFNIEHSRSTPSRKHHADVDRARVPPLSLSLVSLAEKNVSFPLSRRRIPAFFFFLSSVGRTDARYAGPLKLGSCPLARRAAIASPWVTSAPRAGLVEGLCPWQWCVRLQRWWHATILRVAEARCAAHRWLRRAGRSPFSRLSRISETRATVVATWYEGRRNLTPRRFADSVKSAFSAKFGCRCCRRTKRSDENVRSRDLFPFSVPTLPSPLALLPHRFPISE